MDALPNGFQRLFSASHGKYFITMSCQTALQRTHDLDLVVYHQQAGFPFRHSSISPVLLKGSVKRNSAPPPARSSTQILPPCASTSPRQMAKPSPVPWVAAAVFVFPRTR